MIKLFVSAKPAYKTSMHTHTNINDTINLRFPVGIKTGDITLMLAQRCRLNPLCGWEQNFYSLTILSQVELIVPPPHSPPKGGDE